MANRLPLVPPRVAACHDAPSALLCTAGDERPIAAICNRYSLCVRPVAQMHARVLIIDDEPANVLLLEAFLSDTATEVRGLNDSRQVEDVFKEFEPDIVLLDLHMPGVDGLEVLRRLSSARESLGFLPVIVLTADTSRVARNSALLLGANDFLLKPLDRTEVVLRVRNLLHTRELFGDLAEARRLLERDQSG